MGIDFRDLPILVTGFSRPEFLNNALSKIVEVGMRNVWVALDGPRLNYSQDFLLTKKCISILQSYESIPKNRQLLRESNMGCKYGMASAISWFLANNSYGVVIEDDLVFGQEFFEFQFEALRQFEFDETIGSITGYLPIADEIGLAGLSEFQYLRHDYFCAWGWGTWANRWKYYDVELDDWRNQIKLSKLVRKFGIRQTKYWTRRFGDLEAGRIDTWDFQFLFTHFRKDWQVITPPFNLIQNVGFGESATHTKKIRLMPAMFQGKPEYREFGTACLTPELNRAYLRLQFGI